MIVERWTFHPKPGCVGKAAEILKSVRSKSDNPDSIRIYTPNISSWSDIIYETEYEDLETCAKAWEKWLVDPDTREFMEQWVPLMDTGGSREIWNLLE